MLPLEQLPSRAPGAGYRQLAGVRILDLTTSIAGPYATMLLADMGAEVIKIERPGSGDDCRAWGPPFLDGESLWFQSVNRNKASVTLDYGKPEGRAVFEALVAKCDVVVVNLVERVQRKLGIDHATLAKIRGDIVHLSLTGFGLDGERRDRPCYDLIAEGYSGIMDITGAADSEPQKVGTPAADLLSGMDAAFAIACALHERKTSGKGCRIDISMIESMTRFLAPRIVPYLGSGDVPKRTGARDSVISVYRTFDTADEPITLGLGNDNIWKRFWVAVGEPAVGEDPRYETNAKRNAVRPEIYARIETLLRSRPRAEWLDLFTTHNVPAGPVNRVDQVAQDPELLARGFLYNAEAGERRIPQVGLGIRIDGADAGYRTPPPRLGEQTESVLRDLLGYDTAAIDALRAAKSI